MKVLHDLHTCKYPKVHVVYFGDEPEDLMYVADLEFWTRAPGWSLSVMVDRVPKGAKWEGTVGSSRNAIGFKDVPESSPGAGVFLSVHPITRVSVSDRFEHKGFKRTQLHWIN